MHDGDQAGGTAVTGRRRFRTYPLFAESGECYASQAMMLGGLAKELIRRGLRRFGFELRAQPRPSYGSAREFACALSIVRPYSMLPEARLLSLYEQVRYCEDHGLEGDYVECGVWKGGAVGMMALASRCGRRLHLFDSFEGICEPDAEIDGARAVAEAGAAHAGAQLIPVPGIYDKFGGHGTLEDCRHLLEHVIGHPGDLIHYHQGWLQRTVPAADIPKIAILRLDGDWYASTRVCLAHLLDRVVPGGFVIIDDYGTYEGCRRAVDETLASRPAFLQRVDAGCFYFVKSSDDAAICQSGEGATAADRETAGDLERPAEGSGRAAA
jgi:O-methyltransferase